MLAHLRTDLRNDEPTYSAVFRLFDAAGVLIRTVTCELDRWEPLALGADICLVKARADLATISILAPPQLHLWREEIGPVPAAATVTA